MMTTPSNHIDYKQFRQDLLVWYSRHKRILPWRECNLDHQIPLQQRIYTTWLSEIMLQQTVVKAVLGYFTHFVERWPTVHDLANAPEDDVMQAWAGLGYYSRARNLHKCAKYVSCELKGIFPDREAELLKLPGIGQYTASAIRAIGFNKPATVIDGNIDRIIVRLFALGAPIREIKKDIRANAIPFFEGGHLGDDGKHSDFAQSLMDLGATICTPKSPKCMICPVRDDCQSFTLGLQNKLPAIAIKKEKPSKVGYAYIIRDKAGRFLVEKRPDKGLLAKTWGIPTSEWIEVKKKKLLADSSGDISFGRFELKNVQTTVKESLFDVRHVFTHFSLRHIVNDVLIENLDDVQDKRFVALDIDEFKNLGMPSLFDKIRVMYLNQE